MATSMTATEPLARQGDVPHGDLGGFIRYLRYDLLSGFLVFLIALPLCLGIALASGFPAIAGIFTAIVGALVTPWISNSELTIKGPAAGLIVIVYGCIEAFGGDGALGGFQAADLAAYRMALAVVCAAAVLQIIFGLARGGVLGEFFPISAVHGMLAAIGVIIMAKQFPIALGVSAKGEPLELIRRIPEFIRDLNPEIALIGATGLVIMFLWPLVQRAFSGLKFVPAALVVLLITVPMGIWFDLLHKHTYSFHGHQYEVGETYLVNMPDRVFGMFDFVTLPDFTVFSGPLIWKSLQWVLLFFVIGSLESVLSAKAVDILDPWRRRSNLNRDVLAVGIANLCCGMVGGLPMISEIVRSKSNIDNGARTRFANFWHGVFLLLSVALIPTVLHRIPLAALASMLIFTGFRLTHPKEFLHIYRIGREQLLVFVATLVGVLATDLLVGILIGIGVKLAIHVINGVPLRSLFKSYFDLDILPDQTAVVRARYSAVFSNWLLFRNKLVQLGLLEGRNVVLDLSQTKLVDHSVMEKLHELQEEFTSNGLQLELRGLEEHLPLSGHALAARKRTTSRLRRITIIAPQSLEDKLVHEITRMGASGYTSVPCRGAGRTDLAHGHLGANSQVRLEVIVPPDTAQEIFDAVHAEMGPDKHITACMESVEVLRHSAF